MLSQQRSQISGMIDNIGKARGRLGPDLDRATSDYVRLTSEMNRLNNMAKRIGNENSAGKEPSCENKGKCEDHASSLKAAGGRRVGRNISHVEQRRAQAEKRKEELEKDMEKLQQQRHILQDCLNQLLNI